jgi:hypothetical protein
MNEEMYPYLLDIDGSRAGQDQGRRITRIHRIIGYAQALADLDNDEYFIQIIESIYDDKGYLTVIWKIQPTDKRKEYLQKAWESIVADYEGNPIEHDLNEN